MHIVDLKLFSFYCLISPSVLQIDFLLGQDDLGHLIMDNVNIPIHARKAQGCITDKNLVHYPKHQKKQKFLENP